MPVLNRIAGFADEMTAWRRHLHMHPEIGFECHETAAYVAERLREFGVDEVHEGIGKTGVVAVIHGRGPGPMIGLRSDMDALAMQETTGKAYASTVAGKMHACGHDGHMTMLLGAAKYLAETRRFSGSVALIFQPAEEDGGGGKAMIDDGLFDRFPVTQVYAIHNLPGLEAGHMQTTPGPILAAVDDFEIHITGQGGHAAHPEDTRDPLIAAVAMVQILQSLVSRNTGPMQQAVLSVTQIHAGTASNVIPDTAFINGTLRTFDPELRETLLRRLDEVVEGTASAHGLAARLDVLEGYPATINDADKAAFAAKVAADLVGADNVDPDVERGMGAEDFSFMLERKPGAFMYLGIGPGASLHNPGYDFNDAVAPVGASYFARLVETAQPLAD